MRILIYSYNYHPEPIGIAPLMTELAEGLVKRGHDVRVITAMPNYPQRQIYEGYRRKLYLTEHINGVIVDRCYVRIRPKPNLIDRLLLEGSFVATSFLKALIYPRPDIIILTSPPLLVSLPAAILGWIHRTPVILNLQDILPEAAIKVGLLSNQPLIRALEVVERFAYRTVTKISVIADGFTDNLRSKGVPSSKIVKIPNWVDVNFIRPLPKENNSFRTAHNLNGKFVILYSGNIALTQGLETLIKAASRVNHIRDIVIVIVGEEKALGRLKQCCRNWNANNVKLLPFQPREKLPEMLAAADVGLVIQKQNVISFNMPSKIQVLLASGRPILASVPANGTAARAVKKSGGGIVVPPEDPETLAATILELYNDPATVTLLGNRSRQHALQYYSFDQALNRYEELFSDIQKKRLLAAVQKS
ncbi:MAG: glycosyltransferase family 4 protein [Moorea sp. SIO3I7]|uniref:glycosyltransferase family 4 protein n=2 Tax=unclassified Moorena TaxID=2683338 RepID=UPI0013C8E100|nr:glycosyltransferase family 4 protein [Moorena sp. SIO4A5]NEN99378.1 glycosyltransferase family 4 protein [Moorena sp. SIO3I7]NEO24740.1 glycosyltransferase family 4 protein [Moorena sp. SIO4A5]NEO48592.1 glycosyltransferase family 4 protein [Moorena sp. SIO4A3]NEO62476.1 glycosyltransferase family 4 protein [Moorena sp. SIO4G2]